MGKNCNVSAEIAAVADVTEHSPFCSRGSTCSDWGNGPNINMMLSYTHGAQVTN